MHASIHTYRPFTHAHARTNTQTHTHTHTHMSGIWLTSTGILLVNYETTYSDSTASSVAFRIGIPFLVVYIAIRVSGVISQVDAKRCVRREWEIYNHLFSLVSLQEQKELVSLRSLAQAVEGSLSSIAHINPPFQCWTEHQQTAFLSSSHDEVIWEGPRKLQGPGSIQLQGIEAVNSLGYLHKLALEADMLLRDKVLHWASRSGGYFFALGLPELKGDSPSAFFGTATGGGRSSTARFTTEDACIHWCSLKSLTRAIEKSIRCYNGDVSKLTDFCRQAIIFDSVADITRCLNEIQNDQSVSIVRIKNRLDPQYDVAQTAGYRDVNINIRMLHRDSDASKKCDHLLGGNEENVAGRGLRAPGNWPGGGSQGQPLVTLLISEVQLILREFAMVLPPPPSVTNNLPTLPLSRLHGHAAWGIRCFFHAESN